MESQAVKTLTILALSLLSSPLLAQTLPGDGNTIPEPETLFLLGIGAVALLAFRKKRK